jgi:hypothetical protein
VLFPAERVWRLLALGVACAGLGAFAAGSASAAATKHAPVFAYAKQFAPRGVAPQHAQARAPADPCVVLLCYRGGSVQLAPRIYVVLWGDWSSTGDPSNVQGRLVSFLKGVGGSAWARTLGQYGQGCIVASFTCPSTAALIANPANQLAGTWKDATPVPATPSQSSIAAEAVKAASFFRDYSINAQYIVALPRGHGDSSFVAKGGRSCAWHSWVSLSKATSVFFTALPYMPDAGRTCGNYSVNRDPLDGVSIVESHEYAETVTDPYAGGGPLEGWDDNTRIRGEIGDKCVTTQNTTLTTGAFAVQSLWSNAQYSAASAGCVFR